MNTFLAALWAETLKTRRSKVPPLTLAAFAIIPLVGGLFMIIMKDPDAARSMGLIGTKAQLVAGSAEWPVFFDLLAQAVAIGGAILFAIITIWVFGREFADHTAKDLLALPTSKEAIITAKLTVIVVWSFALTLFSFGLAVVVGRLVVIPGWSPALQQAAFVESMGTALLTIALLPYVALIASMGRGYLPPFGWALFTVFLAQISAVLGWGGVVPWAVPALFSGAAGPRAEMLGWHSYLIVGIAGLAGLAALYGWWRSADQAR
jgi:ABC-2 type transport system permease protein